MAHKKTASLVRADRLNALSNTLPAKYITPFEKQLGDNIKMMHHMDESLKGAFIQCDGLEQTKAIASFSNDLKKAVYALHAYLKKPTKARNKKAVNAYNAAALNMDTIIIGMRSGSIVISGVKGRAI